SCPLSVLVPPTTNSVPQLHLSGGSGTTFAGSAGCCGARSRYTVTFGPGNSELAAAWPVLCFGYDAPFAGSRHDQELETVSKTQTRPFSSPTPSPSPPKMYTESPTTTELCPFLALGTTPPL